MADILYGAGESQSGSIRVFTNQEGVFRPRSAAAAGVPNQLSAINELITGQSSELNFSKAVERAQERFNGSEAYSEMDMKVDPDLEMCSNGHGVVRAQMLFYIGNDGWAYDSSNRKILAYTDPSVDLYYRQIWADNAIGLELTGGTNFFGDTSYYVKPAAGSSLNWDPVPQWSSTVTAVDSSACGNLITGKYLLIGDDVSYKNKYTDVSTPIASRYYLPLHCSYGDTFSSVTVDTSYTNQTAPCDDMLMTNGWFRIGFWARFDSSYSDVESVFIGDTQYIKYAGSGSINRIKGNTEAELSDYDRSLFCTDDQPAVVILAKGRILEPGGSEDVYPSFSLQKLTEPLYLPTRWTWCQYVAHVDRNSQVRKLYIRSKLDNSVVRMYITGITVERVEGPDTDRTGFTWPWDSSYVQKILSLPNPEVRRLGDPDRWKRFYEWCATAPQPCEVRRTSIVDSSAGPYTRHTICPGSDNFHLLNRDDFGRMLDEEPRDVRNMFRHQDELDISVMPFGISNYNQAYHGTGSQIVCSETPNGKETGWGDHRYVIGFDGTNGEAWPADSCIQVLDIDPGSHPTGGSRIVSIKPSNKIVSVFSPRITIDSSYSGYMVIWYWLRNYNVTTGWAFEGDPEAYGYLTDLSSGITDIGQTDRNPHGWSAVAVWSKFRRSDPKPQNFRIRIVRIYDDMDAECQIAGMGCMLTGNTNPADANDYIGTRRLMQIHHPHDRAGATTHFPISDSAADEWLQMVRMPNIWCAPTINPDTGATEFWFSIDRRLPGMIPWFNNEDENGFPQDSGRYKLLARYRGTPRWQVADRYGYDGVIFNAQSSAANGGHLAKTGYNSTSSSFDFYPTIESQWTTAAYGLLRGTVWGVEASGTYAMTWWEYRVLSWLHAAWYGTIKGEKTNLRNTARAVKKFYGQDSRIWATQSYLTPTGETDCNEAAYSHLTLDGSVLPWGSGIGSCPWYPQTHDMYDGSIDRYEAVPRSAVFMWIEDPVLTRLLFAPGMYTFSSFLRDKGPAPVQEYYNDPSSLGMLNDDLAGDGPVDGSTWIHRECVWDEVRFTYSADAANFIKFVQNNSMDNHYRPDHYRRRAKVLNSIGAETGTDRVYRTGKESIVCGIGYVDPLGLPVYYGLPRAFDSVRVYPKESWLRIGARSSFADTLFYTDCMTKSDPADASFAPMLFDDYVNDYGNNSLYTKWIIPGHIASGLTTNYYPEDLNGQTKTSHQPFWRCVEAARCAPSMFSSFMIYSNVNFPSGGITARLALDITD